MTSKLEVGFQRTKKDVEFDVPAMAQLLEDAYLSNQREQKAYKRKTFPPSGVGYGSGVCPRRWYYAFEGDAIPVDDVNVLGQANMDYGSEAGDRIAKLFEKADILVEAERLAVSSSPPIKGFIDIVATWNDKKTIGEVKTTKQEAFTLLKASGKPRGYQLIQLLIYMKIEEAEQGFMLYENKNTGEMLIMPVYMTGENKRIIDQAFEWFQQVWDNKELPVRPFDKTSFECRYCPFKQHCWKDKTDATVELPVLEVPTS